VDARRDEALARVDRDTEDRSAIERHRAGDSSAFEALVRRHIEWAARFAARMAGVDAAEDIVQDAFVRVHRSLGDFEGRASFRTYLYRVVVNAARDHLAGERRRRERSGSLESVDSQRSPRAAVPHASRRDDPLAVLERRELEDCLLASVDALPPAQRETLLLRVHEELSYREIAEILSVTVHAVKWNLAAARERLAEVLGSKRRTGGGQT